MAKFVRVRSTDDILSFSTIILYRGAGVD